MARPIEKPAHTSVATFWFVLAGMREIKLRESGHKPRFHTPSYGDFAVKAYFGTVSSWLPG